MPLAYSCFISYRHTKQYKGQTYTQRIVEDLKAELDLRVAQEVFRDTERLRGAEFYNEALATELCRSVCMVVLYWPTYFDQTHLFCAREFRAMEALERKRLQLLPPAEQNNGLIVVVALRDFDQIPAVIKSKRLCKDFEAYTLKTNLREDIGFQSDVMDIGRYIAARCRAFEALPPDSIQACTSFRLPSEAEVRPWVQRIACPGPPFANRERPL